jgi:hypothetical protein
VKDRIARARFRYPAKNPHENICMKLVLMKLIMTAIGQSRP